MCHWIAILYEIIQHSLNMKCPNKKCNKELSIEWNICPYCGFKLIKSNDNIYMPEWMKEEQKSIEFKDNLENETSKQTSERLCNLSVKKLSSQIGEDLIVSVGNTSFKMIYVKGGTFQMGATSEQGLSFGFDFLDARKPAHTVILSDYYVGESVVTRELWNNVTGGNPLKADEVNLPKDNISWYDCNAFIRKLNQITGKRFRLPTEAEWEYAARGGTNSLYLYRYAGDNNIDAVAWYEKNSNDKIHPVMTKKPNKLGLYDMSGNVHEWCNDWHGKYSSQRQTNPQGPLSGRWRICRGGCSGSLAVRCEVAVRDSFPPEFEGPGFRLALSV